MESNDLDDDFEDIEPTGFRWPIGWGVMLAIGLAAYEITAQPRWGIALTCTKLLWSDLATGLWWLRRDPWRQRGVCGMTILVIRATAKYAFTLTATALLVSPFEDPGPKFEETTLGFTFLVGVSSLAFWMVSGLFITFQAVMGRVHLWVDRNVTRARIWDEFPPTCCGWNQTIWLLLGSRIAEWIVGVCFFGMIADRLSLSLPLGIAFVVAGWILLLIGQIIVSRRIIARTPEQCWGPNQNFESTRLGRTATSDELP